MELATRPRLRLVIVVAAWVCIIRWIPKWLGNYAAARRRDGARLPREDARNSASQQSRGRLRPSKGSESRVQPRQSKRSGKVSGNKSSKDGLSDPKPELWAAVENGDVALVQKLLQNGASVNDTYKAWTPVMKAAEEGYIEVTQMLLARRCNLEAVNKTGRTALSFTAAPSMGRQPNPTVLQILLQAGANIDHKDVRGETAKSRAIRDGHHASAAAIDAFEANIR